MKFCNKCGAELKHDVKFCNSCGNRIKDVLAIDHPKIENQCPKCKSEIFQHATFCGECGYKITRAHKSLQIRVPHKIWSEFPRFKIIIMFFIIAMIILLPTKVVSHQVEVPYIDKEQYSVEVPYEDIEEYIVQVPYETEEQYTESVPYTEQEAYQDTECAFLGLFCEGVTKYRTVTKYKDVIKTEQVTKYRDETKYRKVTKTRTEVREKEVQKVRSETRHKEVNWVFGFDALIKFRNLSGNAEA